MFQSIGASASRTFQGANAHPGMHRTNSVDYIYIISGEIYVILDKQQLLLRAGDTLIDAGANHSWANRSGKPCIMLAAIVGAQRP
jgi:quercetin dioxygenase-like cupin family protein